MKQLLVFLFLLCSVSVSAQDVIVKKDGSTILSKVIEIGQEEIKYKKFDNLDGPIYTVQKSEIQSINYQNGAKDTFSAPIREENRYLPNNQNDGEQWMNDSALLKMDAELNKKNKKLIKIGWIGGGVLLAASVGFMVEYCLDQSYEEYDSEWSLPVSLACAGAAIAWTTGYLIAANHPRKINEGAMVHNSSIIQHDFLFSNGSSFSLGADLLSDRTQGSHTLGIGLRYNF